MQRKNSTMKVKSTILLIDWMRRHNYSRIDFANLLNCHYNQVFYWLTGRAAPSLYWAIQIQKVTDGWVSALDWEDLILRTDSRHKRKNSKKKANATRNNDKGLDG